MQPGFGGGTVPGGWPNGRRFGDDVLDIAVTALISDLRVSPPMIVGPAGDNVDRNDIAYNKVFPYAATPLNGRNAHPLIATCHSSSGPGCRPGPLLLTLIALVWMALSSTVVRAHDPGLSALDINVSDGAVSASLSIAAPDVAFVTGGESDARRKLSELAHDAVRLSVDGEVASASD